MAIDDQQPPWGRKQGPQTPEEALAAVFKKIKQSFGGGGGGAGGLGVVGKVFFVILLLFLLNAVFSSVYTLEPPERGVVLRFGKYNKTASPGLNYKIPLIDYVVKVNVDEIRKEEFGFRTTKAAQRSQYAKRGFDHESLMLTADKNVIDVEWIVQYKIRDPFNFIFKVKDVPQAVRDVSEMAIRRNIGNMDFDYVLSNREILAGTMARELQATLDKYNSGVDIVTVQLQDVNPPETVKPAFNEVNEADQDMKRLVNEAEEAYNQVIPKARGSAKKLLEEAHGYAVERVNLAKGETFRFEAVLKEYNRAKNVTRKRMYLETMQNILPSVTEVYVIDKEQRSVLPFLNVGGERKK